MRNFIERISEKKITILDWIIGFLGILFVRFILESISSPAPSGMMPTDPYTLIHYGLFFLCLLLGLTYIVGFFTKKYSDAGKFILFIFPIMWVAPILDLLISRNGNTMSYIYNLPKDLSLDFFRFFIFSSVKGITLGMHIQIIIFYCAIAFYVWLKEKNYISVILTLISSYIFMFILGAIPSLIYAVTHVGNIGLSKLDISYYLSDLMTNSNIFHNTLHESAYSVSPFRFFQLGFNKLMSQILFILSTLFVAFFLYKIETEKFKAVIKNSRPERILYYLTPLLFAMGFAYFENYGKFYSLVDLLGITCLLLSWFGMWMYSVHINDIYDVEIDKISNTKRPSVQKTLDISDMRNSGYVFLSIALIGSWCASFYTFFFVLVGIAVAYIYSAPPLRLRQIPLISSFILSVVILSATLSGFFFVSFDKTIHTFSTLISLGIIIFYTLQINFKDMKDVEGDGKEGVWTIPTIYKENGPKIVGLLFALSFLLAPVFLSFYFLYIFTIPISIIGYRIITKKPYHEKHVFILHFLFLLIIVSLYAGLHFL